MTDFGLWKLTWQICLAEPWLKPKQVKMKLVAQTGGSWSETQLRRAQRVAEKRRTGEELADIAAEEDVSLDWVTVVLEAREAARVELAKADEIETAKQGRDESQAAHLDELRGAARDTRALIADGHVGWSPPEYRIWEPHLADEDLEKWLLDHLRDTDVGRLLQEWKREGRELSRQAQKLMDRLRERYPEARRPDDEGFASGFHESVYHQALQIARGEKGLGAGYEKLESGDMWELRQGAWGLARAKGEEALERAIQQHKEAIRSLAEGQEVKRLLARENKVTDLAKQTREKLGLFAPGWPIPGRCRACSEGTPLT